MRSAFWEVKACRARSSTVLEEASLSTRELSRREENTTGSTESDTSSSTTLRPQGTERSLQPHWYGPRARGRKKRAWWSLDQTPSLKSSAAVALATRHLHLEEETTALFPLSESTVGRPPQSTTQVFKAMRLSFASRRKNASWIFSSRPTRHY